MTYESSELSQIPENMIEVDVETGKKIMKLIEAIEDNDDVQNVHVNADFPDELLEELAG